MTNYRWLLMDADNTLFDFDAAEDYALSRTLVSHEVTPSPERKARYRIINSALWAAYDQGKISQEAIGPRRFQQFFEETGLAGDPGEWSQSFLRSLAGCPTLLPGAEALCRKLSNRYILSLTTNGISQVQRQRLKDSPLAPYFGDRVFISGEMGCRKPENAYFETVLEALGAKMQRSKVLVIGDRLSSDIRGAFNARLDSVWLRRPGAKAGAMKPTYEVDSLAQLSHLLGTDRLVHI